MATSTRRAIRFSTISRLTSDGIRTLNFNIPTTFDTFPSLLSARFRLCSASGACNTYGGSAADGEVEDYRWGFGPLAVTLESLQAQPTTSPVVPVALVGVSAAALVGVVFFIRRRKTA